MQRMSYLYAALLGFVCSFCVTQICSPGLKIEAPTTSIRGAFCVASWAALTNNKRENTG